MEIKPLTYKWLSALMCYPESDLLEALPELQAALSELPELKNNPHRAGLDKFLDHVASHTLRELQEDYVLVFDRSRHHALYIFEHVYGEDRDRGSAMVDLLEEYRRYGYELGDDELPDYLPALLEFFSHIAKKLELYGSPYAALLNAVVALSPVEPQPLIEPPVRDMDEAMETFGPDNQGLEPLLKPKMGGLQTVQFYPTGNRPNA